jgi:hypothetical protein
MQTKMALKFKVILWILRLKLPVESNFHKLRLTIATRFQRFIPRVDGTNNMKMQFNDNGCLIIGTENLHIPLGPVQLPPMDLSPLLPPHSQHRVILMKHLN